MGPAHWRRGFLLIVDADVLSRCTGVEILQRVLRECVASGDPVFCVRTAFLRPPVSSHRQSNLHQSPLLWMHQRIKSALLPHCPQITRVVWSTSWRGVIRKRIFQDFLFPVQTVGT